MLTTARKHKRRQGLKGIRRSFYIQSKSIPQYKLQFGAIAIRMFMFKSSKGRQSVVLEKKGDEEKHLHNIWTSQEDSFKKS